MNATAHRLVDSYLGALDEVARSLPRRERDELVEQIRTHLAEAVTEDMSEADVRNVLDALGDPHDIVAAAGPVRAPVRRGAREVFALLFLVSGIPPILGWLAGLGLLISSPLWTTRQKWLGAFVWPGGWFGLFILVATPATVTAGSCTSSNTFLEPNGSTVITGCASSHTITPWLWAPGVILAVGLPIVVAIYLWRVAGRRSAA